MRLIDKIFQVADDLEKEAFNYPKMRTMDVVNNLLRKLANEYNDEKEKDEFAIGFAEWLIENKVLSSKMPTKELLEIYKKEKGL